jgi:glutamate 5-kinase
MPDRQVRENQIAGARRIVVKVGTNSICHPAGGVNHQAVEALAAQIAPLIAEGRSVILVASGAIGTGLAELGLAARPTSLPMLQATAAVGQAPLMRAFHDAFAAHGQKVAQVLVTRDAFEDRTRYLNVRNTLGALADLRVLPIINENDTVATDEIRFGENDVLAALVTNMIGAEVLVLLTNVDGLMQDGQVLDVVEQVGPQTHSLVLTERSALGSGGMTTKLTAAGMVTQAGSAAVIANASSPQVLGRLLSGERIGTVFIPAQRRLSSRRRWIGQASRPAGRLVIDDGAARALLQRGKSLLPSGIVAVSGRFARGATVAVFDTAGREIARGLVNYGADQLDRIKGLRSSQIAKTLGEKPYDEAIHRNNLMLR